MLPEHLTLAVHLVQRDASVPPLRVLALQQALNELLAVGLGNHHLRHVWQHHPTAVGARHELDAVTGGYLAQLRYYFDVNNAYVRHKLQVLALPFRHKEWERKTSAAPGGVYEPRPPSEDPNAPDLYLPLMGYVTYILVAGFVSGADGRFTPEVLASTGSLGFGIVLFEVMAIWFCLYLLQASGTSIKLYDLASVSGYKFLAATLVVLVKTFLGTLAGYLAIIICGANIGLFMVKTLHQVRESPTAFDRATRACLPGRVRCLPCC